jgi:hypothetical protein
LGVGFVMEESRSFRRLLLVLPLLLLFALLVCPEADAQGGPLLPASSTPLLGSDTIPVSSGMLTPFLPRIPNLEFGFLYSFGKNVRTGRFTADYVLPFKLSCDSVLFGEAHAEGWDFWKRPTCRSRLLRVSQLQPQPRTTESICLLAAGTARCWATA